MSTSDPTEIAELFVSHLHRQEVESDRIVELVRWGDPSVEDNFLFAVALAVIERVEDDDLWMVGDGLIEEALAPRSGMIEKLKLERTRRPQVQRLFEVMMRYHESRGQTSTWWHY